MIVNFSDWMKRNWRWKFIYIVDLRDLWYMVYIVFLCVHMGNLNKVSVKRLLVTR